MEKLPVFYTDLDVHMNIDDEYVVIGTVTHKALSQTERLKLVFQNNLVSEEELAKMPEEERPTRAERNKNLLAMMDTAFELIKECDLKIYEFVPKYELKSKESKVKVDDKGAMVKDDNGKTIIEEVEVSETQYKKYKEAAEANKIEALNHVTDFVEIGCYSFAQSMTNILLGQIAKGASPKKKLRTL